MNRNTSRACDFVPAAGRRGERRSLTFLILGPDEVILDDSLETRLGFAPEQAAAASRRFAEELGNLTHHLAGRSARELSASPRPAGGEGESLRLDPETCRRCLEGLRGLGAGLRGMLHEDLVGKARACGFPAEAEEDEPALTFFTRGAPVVWEMMYEGSQVEPPDWRRFWGFRTPVTHWMIGGAPTSREIRVGRRVFSATSEDLAAAGVEVSDLVGRLEQHGPGLSHGSLARALRERVVRESSAPAGGTDLPWDWLRRHLEAMPPVERQRWKRRALVEIFRDAGANYGVIHFACHCAGGHDSRLAESLLMNVGGEPVTLDVVLMATDLRHLRPAGEPGPLVFLNACGTNQPGSSAGPHGLAGSWIDLGAVAVITTLCPIPDHFAQSFAAKFYEFLFRAGDQPDAERSRDPAEALLATRRYFMQEYNNPLGLAYSLYARKGARVMLAGRGG
jgi:hypothetical protein